jgi:threonine synthase
VKSLGLSENVIRNLVNCSFEVRAEFVLSRFWDEFTINDIRTAVSLGCTREKFGTASIVPLMPIDNDKFKLELWHGPTGTFKDIPAQILPHLIPAGSLVLMATAGNAATAAFEGFKDVRGVRVIAFFPNNHMTEIQRLRMITQDGENLMAVGVDGELTEMQKKLDVLMADVEYAHKLQNVGYTLTSLNTVRHGRVAPLTVCLFSAYCELIMAGEIEAGEEINIEVPSRHKTLVQALELTKRLFPISRMAKKTIVVEAENPNEICENTLEELRERQIVFDAICKPENMRNFVDLVI